jgi:integrase/recombinase XerD
MAGCEKQGRGEQATAEHEGKLLEKPNMEGLKTFLENQGQPQDHSGARTDAELVGLWLGTKRSENTRRAYAKDAEAFLTFLGPGRGLRGATVADLQAWADSLKHSTTTKDRPISAATKARRIAAVKSLLAFGNKTGYLPFNVGTVVSAPKPADELAERILSEHEVGQLLSVAKGRDQAMVALLYLSGARISEVLALTWRQIHVDEKDGTASVTLHGKGDKTRHVRIPPAAVQALDAIRPNNPNNEPEDDYRVFRSAKGLPLDDRNVRRTLRSLAKKAELALPVSPHWLRHAHASHALDRGAPIHLVQQTLGHSSVSTTGRYLHVKPGQSSGQFLPHGGTQTQEQAPIEAPKPIKEPSPAQDKTPKPRKEQARKPPAKAAQGEGNELTRLRDRAIKLALQEFTPGQVAKLRCEELSESDPVLSGQALEATRAWLFSTGYEVGVVFRPVRPDGQAEVSGLTPRQIARIGRQRPGQ